MFLSQIEKKMPGTTTGVVEPKKKPPTPRAVREWTPRIVQATEPEPEPELPPLDIVDDRSELEKRVEALLSGDVGKPTRTCGVEIPLALHAELLAESKARKVSLKSIVLECITEGHKTRQMR